MSQVRHILGMKLDMVQIPQVVEFMENWINNNFCHNYIVIANADTAVKAKLSERMKEAVNSSSLSVPDGFPLMLLGRIYGFPLKRRVYGPDVMFEFLKSTKDKGYSHFFYGSTEDTLNKLTENAQNQFTKLRIAGTYAPPFRNLTPEEDEKIVDLINSASPSVLWVGLGCPKQELWMFEHRDRLKVPVMVGVGAAFDFWAGVKPQAPPWVRNHGFEWLFRLITEPRRLWKRYLIGNLLFLYFILKEFIQIKILKKSTSSIS